MEDDNPFTKSQTIDPEVRAYVYSLVNALGGTSGDIDGRYVLGDDALAVLRDLKRWLRLYDEKTNRLDVARCLAEAKLVVGDLIPILASWSENGKNDKLHSRTALACLEILVPLTWPLEQKEMTVNHHRHTPYLQQAQVLYKAGILNWNDTHILRQAIRVGLPSIAMSRDERTSRDEGIIKLMLYFIRNVTMIRQIPNLPSQELENEVSRSATIEAFREQDVFALLLTICSNMGEDFNLQDIIILEILFNLIKGVSVEKLWMTEAQRKGREVSDLKATLSEEKSTYQEYKKNGPSRHGRFGTMIWLKRDGEKNSAISGQDNIRDNRNALMNIDKSKKWNKPLQKRKDIDHTINDFDREIHLTTSATEKLRNFAEEFLDSAFNPLITHLRKAIEREAERMLDINYRQFFYVVAWFLQAERVRREKHRKELKPANLTSEFGAESFGLVAAVLNQETFVTINRYMQSSLDNKEWQDLNACMRCFTQILLTVQEMAQSPLEEDQEIADNIQNRIFYEETTHDKISGIVKGYKDQGFGYLDSCTELSHVFLRMLERYSKENADLQVRSRRRAKKKKKEEKKIRTDQSNEEADEDLDSENEDIVDVAQVSRERKFDFKRFAAKFTSQSSVNTFIALITFFRELSLEQLKRAHRFFYRVAFKQELAVLLYRVDIVALFYKMVQGPEGLPRQHPMYAEYSELSKQVFRKMFKKLDQRPELLVELLFSKINKTLYYLEYGHDKVTSTVTRAPAELEVKPAAGSSISEQIGLVVTILIKDEKSNLVTWVKEVLEKAYDERHGWEAEAEARRAVIQTNAEKSDEAQNEEASAVKPSHIVVTPADTETQTAMFKNARLRLLMKLVGFENLDHEETLGATWIVPADVKSDELHSRKLIIEQYEMTPWQSKVSDIEPEDMLRRSRQINYSAALEEGEEVRRDAFIDDSEGDDNVDLNEDFLFPDNVRSKSANSKRNLIEELKAKRRLKRKRDRPANSDEDADVDDELADKRRRLREEAALDRRRKIKSELYIRDSDDETDEEEDRDFFQREEETRRRQEERVRGLMAQARREVAAKMTQGSHKKQKKAADGDETTTATEIEDGPDTARSSQTMRRSDSDVDMSDQELEKETPLSSPHISGDDRDDDLPVLKELSQPRIPSVATETRKDAIMADIELEDGSEEEDNAPVLSPPLPMRRSRAGFIIDSDDDE